MMITVQNARQMAARSLEARRASKQAALERENLLKRLLAAEENRLLQSAENPVQRPVEAPDNMARRIEMAQGLEDHMKRLDQMMQEERQPSSLAHLAGARSKLFENWRILGGIPMPGSFRPSKERKPSYVFTPPQDS